MMDDQQHFEIRVQGHISNARADFFEAMNIRRESDGTTTLHGPLPDQTALHSILIRIRDLNLKIISVNEVG
jgi:hypothetical protein